MPDADTLIDRFLQDQDDIKDKWKLWCINPYSSAYEVALQAFKDKLKEQEDADKAEAKWKMDLLMLALSLCGGGILTAAFGSAAAKTLATDAAMNVIYKYNMERAFRAAYIISTNKTAGFIAGKVWDEAEKRVGDAVTEKFKSGMAENPSNFPSTQNLGAVSMANMLENFVLEAKVKGADAAKLVRDNGKLKNDEKLAQLDKLKNSSFYRPPKASVDNGRLADEIELSFYLKMVLASDFLVSYETYYRTEHDGLGRSRVADIRNYQRVEITESAGSQNYPMDHQKSGNYTYDVDYNKVGGIVRDRINKLYKDRFKDTFMGSKIDTGVMLKAEEALKYLGGWNIRRLIENVKAATP